MLVYGRVLPAQSTVEINGSVLNSETGESLSGAQVQIVGTLLGDVCDEEGRFTLSGLKPAVYRLKVSFIGFAAKEIQVDLRTVRQVKVKILLQTVPVQLDQVIVTGSRQPENLAAAVASVSVMNAREMEARNSFRIDDALLALPGISLAGDKINIRGGSGYNRLGGSRVLVLLDDVPVLTSDLGNMNWNVVPVTAVDHVEVLKGAASSLYGSGALSGVINILTKNPDSRPDFQFHQSVGIFDQPSVPQWKWTDRTLYFHRSDFGYSNRFGRLGVRFDLAHHFSTGDREMGRFNRWYFTGKSKLVLPDQSNLTLFLSYSYDDRELFLRWLRQNNALSVPPGDRGNRFKLKGAFGYAVYQKLLSPMLSAKIRLAYNRQLLGVPFHLTSSFQPALGLSGQMQMNWMPHPDHRISTGIDFSRDQVESKYYGKRRANGVSPYIQEIWKISRLWQLNIGARFDTYSLAGDSIETQLSPRIGFSYQPFQATILHFSYGKGFRAASVVERYLSVDSGGDVRVVANPQLSPERSVLWDAGIRQTLGRSAFAELTAFVSEYENLIELTLLPQSLSVQYLSYPRARISGLETVFHWKIWREHFSINANATRLNPVFVDSGEPLPYRSRLIGFLTPQFVFGPFSLAADFQYASRVERVMVYPKDERVPVKIWNLRLRYKWRNLAFKFVVQNAGNYNYTVSERVLGEIRNFSVSVSGKF